MGGADGIHQPLRGQRIPQRVPATNSDENHFMTRCARLGSIPTRCRHLGSPFHKRGFKNPAGDANQSTTGPGSCMPLEFALIGPILRMRPGLRGPVRRAPSSRREAEQ